MNEMYSFVLKSSLNFHGSELVKLVETTVRSENHRSPNKPIHLVGESLGGCLALAIAARNPDIDLALILANPGEKLLSYIWMMSMGA